MQHEEEIMSDLMTSRSEQSTKTDGRSQALRAHLIRLVKAYGILNQESNTYTILLGQLFNAITAYDQKYLTTLLSPAQKNLAAPFAQNNPELQLSVDDLVNLFAKLYSLAGEDIETQDQNEEIPSFYNSKPRSTSSPNGEDTRSRSAAVLSTRPRTAPLSVPRSNGNESYGEDGYNKLRTGGPVSPTRQTHDPRPDSPDAVIHGSFSNMSNLGTSVRSLGEEMSFEGVAGESGHMREVSNFSTNSSQLEAHEDPSQLYAFYRKTSDLTKKLKESERNLASIARDHEDRIEQLQEKVEELKLDLSGKKREISEYKGKERSSREQILELEADIERLQKLMGDKGTQYQDLKKQYDDKCEEALDVQQMLVTKEADLAVTETKMHELSEEKEALIEERKKLDQARRDLEKDLEKTREAEEALQKKHNENKALKETIEQLKSDLEELRGIRQGSVNGVGLDSLMGRKTLLSELKELDVGDEGAEGEDGIRYFGGRFFSDSESAERVRMLEEQLNKYKQQVEDLGAERDKMRQFGLSLEQERENLQKQLAEAAEKKERNAQTVEMGIQCGDGDVWRVEEPTNSADSVEHFSAEDSGTSKDPSGQQRSVEVMDAMVQCSRSYGMNPELEAHIATLNAELSEQVDIVESLLRQEKENIKKHMESRSETSSSLVRNRTSKRRSTAVGQLKNRAGFVDQLDTSRPGSPLDSTPPPLSIVRRTGGVSASSPVSSKGVVTKMNNRDVNTYTTLIVYGIVAYFCGLITSVFMIENGQSGIAPQGMIPQSDGNRLVETVVYWLYQILEGGPNLGGLN